MTCGCCLYSQKLLSQLLYKPESRFAVLTDHSLLRLRRLYVRCLHQALCFVLSADFLPDLFAGAADITTVAAFSISLSILL